MSERRFDAVDSFNERVFKSTRRNIEHIAERQSSEFIAAPFSDFCEHAECRFMRKKSRNCVQYDAERPKQNYKNKIRGKRAENARASQKFFDDIGDKKIRSDTAQNADSCGNHAQHIVRLTLFRKLYDPRNSRTFFFFHRLYLSFAYRSSAGTRSATPL